MNKYPNKTIDGYRNRLQLALLGPDIAEVLKELGLDAQTSSNMNRYEVLRLWNDEIEQAILRKINQRLHP